MTTPPGTPIWFELTAADRDAVQTFYAAIAGWTFADSPDPRHGGYRMALSGELPVAGLMAPMAPGQPTGWGLYFAHADVDGAARQITELGGAIDFGPADIPDVGRFVTARDPQGVGFALMAQAHDDPAPFQPAAEHADGKAVWIELATPDPDAAFAFYGALFGWTRSGGMPMGEMGEYAFIGAGTAPCAANEAASGPGAIMSSALTGAVAAWNWYVHVPDIDAALATARAEGATVTQGPDEIPGGAFSANLIDPQGHTVGLVGPRRQAQ